MIAVTKFLLRKWRICFWTARRNRAQCCFKK